MKDDLIPILDEQNAVGFTGKVNVLDASTKQLLGDVILLDGNIHASRYKGAEGLKAFFNLCVDEFEQSDLTYIVEPELVDSRKKQIHYPYGILKRKIKDVIENYKASKALKPPAHIKVLINPDFINNENGENVTGEEFELLKTLSDYNLVSDFYKNCKLLDYEITNALVSLRKKNALKVIAKK